MIVVPAVSDLLEVHIKEALASARPTIVSRTMLPDRPRIAIRQSVTVQVHASGVVAAVAVGEADTTTTSTKCGDDDGKCG